VGVFARGASDAGRQRHWLRDEEAHKRALRDVAAGLQVIAHPDATTQPRITISGQMTNGNQMPSIVDLPAPGCWAFAISWGTKHDSLSLQVLPAGSSPAL